MKKAINILLILSISIGLNAQIIKVDRLIKRKAEQKANQKIESEVDKGLDKIFGLGKNSKKETTKDSNTGTDSSEVVNTAQLGGIMGGLLGQGAAPDPTYSFTNSFTMEMSSVDKKGETKMIQKIYLKNDGSKMGIKHISSSDPEMNKSMQMMEMIVFDIANNNIFNFMNSENGKMYMSIKVKDNAVGDYAGKNYDASDYKVTPLSETKEIMGYTCKGYLVEDKKSKSKMWMTGVDIPGLKNYYNSFNKMSSGIKGKGNNYAFEVNPEMAKLINEGKAMLGVEALDGSYSMFITDLKSSDNFSFNTNDYKSIFEVSK